MGENQRGCRHAVWVATRKEGFKKENVSNALKGQVRGQEKSGPCT